MLLENHGLIRSFSVGPVDLLEGDQAVATEDDAVQAKGPEGVGLEPASQESNGAVGGEAGNNARHDGLTAYVVAEGAEQVGQLVEPSAFGSR